MPTSGRSAYARVWDLVDVCSRRVQRQIWAVADMRRLPDWNRSTPKAGLQEKRRLTQCRYHLPLKRNDVPLPCSKLVRAQCQANRALGHHHSFFA